MAYDSKRWIVRNPIWSKRRKPILILVFFFAVGLLLLYYGAEWLVKGSSDLARGFGIRPVVIGLTVVAFGTSAPELVVSLASALQGKSMIAVGNVIGSNICNIALILGLAALFNPISCQRSIIRRDIPIMLGISLCLVLLTLDSGLSRIDGAILLAGIVLYTYFNYWIYLKESKEDPEVEAEENGVAKEEWGPIRSRTRQIIMVIVGIGGVIVGAQAAVECAVRIMTILGVSEKFVGLTIVAFGTSLPELATSVIAAIRKEMDISIGNLVGSNVFNILCVLGATSLARPIPIPGGLVASGLLVDYGVMMLTGLLPWVMMMRTRTLTRADGLILILCYGGYLFYLVRVE